MSSLVWYSGEALTDGFDWRHTAGCLHGVIVMAYGYALPVEVAGGGYPPLLQWRRRSTPTSQVTVIFYYILQYIRPSPVKPVSIPTSLLPPIPLQ